MINTGGPTAVPVYTNTRVSLINQGDLIMIKFPWDTSLSSVFSPVASRRTQETPMSTYRLRLVEHEMAIDIPGEWTVMSVPDNAEFSCGSGQYRCSFELQGQQLLARR